MGWASCTKSRECYGLTHSLSKISAYAADYESLDSSCSAIDSSPQQTSAEFQAKKFENNFSNFLISQITQTVHSTQLFVLYGRLVVHVGETFNRFADLEL